MLVWYCSVGVANKDYLPNLQFSASLCASGALSETVIVMGTRFSRRARRQIPATEQTRAATTKAIPTPANGTRTETDAAGIGQGSSQPGECRSARPYTDNECCFFFFYTSFVHPQNNVQGSTDLQLCNTLKSINYLQCKLKNYCSLQHQCTNSLMILCVNICYR